MTIEIYCDGGARRNPGPAAAAFIAIAKQPDNKAQSEITLKKVWKYLGPATNNQAEYQAVLLALDWLVAFSGLKTAALIQFFLDSTLVVNQLNGLFKIKNPGLRSLLLKARELEAQIQTPLEYHYIPRSQNTQADALVNLALDQQV